MARFTMFSSARYPRFTFKYSTVVAFLGAMAILASGATALAEGTEQTGEEVEGETEPVDPFHGTFLGTVFGHRETTAPIEVVGTPDPAGNGNFLGLVRIGSGLRAEPGGLCGRHDVPEIETMVSFAHLSPTEVEGHMTWPIGPLSLDVTITAALGVDGDSISALIHVNTPFLCQDVDMMALLLRQTEGGEEPATEGGEEPATEGGGEDTEPPSAE